MQLKMNMLLLIFVRDFFLALDWQKTLEAKNEFYFPLKRRMSNF